MNESVKSGDKLKFHYTNLKGKKSIREVLVMNFYFGSTKYHPENQWLLEAYDFDKKAVRIFATKDIQNVIKRK